MNDLLKKILYFKKEGSLLIILLYCILSFYLCYLFWYVVERLQLINHLNISSPLFSFIVSLPIGTGALISGATNLILDEPFNGLDPESCIVIKNLLKDYCYCKHNMILFSVHNLDLVSNFSDTIILINKDRQLLSLKNTQNISELEDYFFKHCVI